MKRYTSFGLLALLFVVALTLASCAGADSGSSEQGSGEQDSEESKGGMHGMDHGNMDMASGSMSASEMVMENGEYSDEHFIDAMAPHHQGAVEMAQVALANAEHPELRQLAENIVADQSAEIERLRAIKQREFGSSDLPTEMSSEELEMMGMMEEPGELANREPFDRAFIDEMIPHHEAAIEMARTASENTSNPEIRELASGIVRLQESEIAQMTEWRREWYPEG
jgi:uncharacterized protein (DUF305 family)